MKYKIGIIGGGFVGGAVAHGFSEMSPLLYDKNPDISKNSLHEVLLQDYVFICVPTPMNTSKGGQCNTSIIDDCLQQISDIGSDAILIIKSTVPVGFTETRSKKFKNLKIVHSPEFLTARNAEYDFDNPDRNILGHSGNISEAERVRDLIVFRFPSVPCLIIKSNESELLKYISNCFLAVKVSFFNEMFDFSESVGADWGAVLQGLLLDPRIGASHCFIPGPDGDRGFGGTCFPKDINSMIFQLESAGVDPSLIKAAWKKNLMVRGDFDWESNISAVNNEQIKE